MNAQATLLGDVEALANELEERGAGGARLALVLGSGLGAFGDALEGAHAIPAEELEHLPGSAVPGHAGRIVVGELAGTRLLVQQGRVHLYEGWSPYEVTRAVRAFARLGVEGLVLTNAAGGLVPEWAPGTFMRVTDHLNLQGPAPLERAEAGAARIYDPALGRALERAARAADVELREGVYAGLLGPTYETPAEIRMLAWLGAQAVGMSTVGEAAVARAIGLRVAAISCITNPAAGLSAEPPSHEEVLEAGRAAAKRFVTLLVTAVPELARALDAPG